MKEKGSVPRVIIVAVVLGIILVVIVKVTQIIAVTFISICLVLVQAGILEEFPNYIFLFILVVIVKVTRIIVVTFISICLVLVSWYFGRIS